MSTKDELRCLHCDQTRAEINRDQTICGIESVGEYRELVEEWPKHRWVGWKDHELPSILPEHRDQYRRANLLTLRYAECEHTVHGHSPADAEFIAFDLGFKLGQCIACGKQVVS